MCLNFLLQYTAVLLIVLSIVLQTQHHVVGMMYAYGAMLCLLWHILCTAFPSYFILQGMLAELHNLAMQVNMRGALSDDYRIRHPNAPKMVQWHSGQDSCTCDSCCGPASIYRLCFAKDMLCLDC